MCNQANTIQGKQNNYQKEFADFVKNCICNNGTLLTVTKDLFTIENLKATKSFLRQIKPLFDKKNEEARKTNKQAKKKVAKTWGIGDIFNGSVFGDDFKDLNIFKDSQCIIIEILLHCNWLMYLCSDRQHKQNQASKYYKKETDKEYFKANIEWAIGPTFSGTSLDAMLFIVELILKVKSEKETEDYIKKIEDLCNNKDDWKKTLKWKETDCNPISTDAIVNIILFFCDKEKYLSIPAQNKKKLISDKLKGLLEKNGTDKTDEHEELAGMSDIDQTLFRIRKNLRSLKIMDKKNKELYQESNPFWHNTIRPFWDDSTEKLDKEQLSDKTLLEYKKAMILYGPPGTSKSYQARKMAEGMIAEALRKQEKISDAITKLPTTIGSHIHILQMHPNYTYDDFIIGKSIDESRKIVVKSGKLLQIIKSIKKEDKIPHFVILDEINRVDISRVFGELFTAMEASYRDKGVELCVNISDIPEEERSELEKKGLINDGKLYLKVPNEMYFIGTMNMIDFSLEQVDFALRRRFLWRLSTYDADRLDEIISEKVKDNNIREGISDDFSKTCTDLNNEIEWESSLGKSYLIGHAFFAEIVDIFKQVNDWKNAKNVLWQVSILPTLEAYCGTMDANMQEAFLTRCKDAFMPELKEDKKKKK